MSAPDIINYHKTIGMKYIVAGRRLFAIESSILLTFIPRTTRLRPESDWFLESRLSRLYSVVILSVLFGGITP